MSTEQWFERATAYFSDAMSPAEMKLFEAETASSEELSQLMQLWKTTDNEAAVYERSEEEATAFIATHQRLKHDFIDKQTAPVFSIPRHTSAGAYRKIKFPAWQWIAAAVILFGIVLGIELFKPSNSNKPTVTQTNTAQSNKRAEANDSGKIPVNKSTGTPLNPSGKIPAATLYAQNFTPDKIPENPNGPLDDAFFYYASAKYKNAVAAIDKAHNKSATRGNNAFTPLTEFYASYYKALSLMSLDSTAAAIPLLNHALQQSPAETLSIKARWYLSLAYLKEEKISAVAETLGLLIHSPMAGTYKNKSEKLLAAIKNE